MGTLKQKFRNIQKLPTWLFFFPALLLKIFRHTLFRVVVIDPNHYIDNARGMVSVTWHNRLLFFPAVFPKRARKRTAAVVSASRDGQYIADLISFFQLKSARGSSKKRGVHAQLEAVRFMQNHYNVSFTPDGPRGPMYQMSKGPIHLASLMHTQIIPVAVNASRYWECRSWDKFQIPKPFSTLTLILGDAIAVPPDLSDAQLEEYRLLVERKLNEISGVAKTQDTPATSNA